MLIVLGGGDAERSFEASLARLGEGERLLAGLSLESERDLLSRRLLTGERERERERDLDTERARLLDLVRRLVPLDELELDDPELEPESESEPLLLLSDVLVEALLLLESEAELSLLEVEAERLK